MKQLKLNKIELGLFISILTKNIKNKYFENKEIIDFSEITGEQALEEVFKILGDFENGKEIK